MGAGDVNDFAQQALNQNTTGLVQIIQQIFAYIWSQIVFALQLAQKNVIWVVVMVALTYIISEYVLGKVWENGGFWRHFLAFIIAMTLSFFWLPAISVVIE
jgi:hypothetical protein